jgi:hypothetical protein
MSADHCESIKLRLQLEGISTEAYELSGQLICVTAEDLLAKFMPSGTLDEALFKSTVSRFIERARASVSTNVSNVHSGKVRLFGEMVSQLRGKDLKATTRLEELWNEVIECRRSRVPGALLDLHSQSIERESAVA